MATASFLEELQKAKKEATPQMAVMLTVIAESVRTTSKMIDIAVTAMIDESNLTGAQTMDNTIDRQIDLIDRQISLISEILNAHDEDTLLDFEDEVDWVLNGTFCGEYLIATRDTILAHRMERFGVLHLVDELLRSLDEALS